MKNNHEKFIIKTKSGEDMHVPPRGSLPLLALGYKGLVLWREARLAQDEKENDIQKLG